MARTLSQREFVENAADIVNDVGSQTIFLEKDGRKVAAIVSMDEYESTHEAQVGRALDTMRALRSQIANTATPQEREQLMRELDTHVS